MATPSRSKATPARIDVAEREAQALELRKRGATFEAIARAVGYADRGAAHRAVSRALDATIRQPAEELRRLEGERLDALTAALWPVAIDGDLRAVDRVLSIMERRAKLFGLDAPSRRAVEVITREAFEKLMGEMEAEVADLDRQLAAAGMSVDDD